MSGTETQQMDDGLIVKTLSWNDIFKNRDSIKFVYCNYCDIFYRPVVGNYESECSKCGKEQDPQSGVSATHIVIVEDEGDPRSHFQISREDDN